MLDPLLVGECVCMHPLQCCAVQPPPYIQSHPLFTGSQLITVTTQQSLPLLVKLANGVCSLRGFVYPAVHSRDNTTQTGAKIAVG